MTMKGDCRCSMMVCGPQCVIDTGHNTTQMLLVAPPMVPGKSVMAVFVCRGVCVCVYE